MAHSHAAQRKSGDLVPAGKRARSQGMTNFTDLVLSSLRFPLIGTRTGGPILLNSHGRSELIGEHGQDPASPTKAR